MREAIVQSFQNLRANKLRSFLTMFGIMWGMISIVILSATGEGFRRGNEQVLRELGRNVGIVWGNRTSLQAGGERAGRRIFLDRRRCARDRRRIVAGCRRQPRARAKRRQREEPVQRRERAHRRHRTAIPGRAHDRDRGRAQSVLDRRVSRRPRGPRRPRHRRPAVRQTLRARRDAVDQWPAVYGRGPDPEEGAGQQLQRTGQQQDLHPVRDHDAGSAETRRPSWFDIQHHRGAPAGGRRRDARSAGASHGADRRHQLAARAERHHHSRPPPRLRSGRSRSAEHLGHLARHGDVRPHDRPDARFLRRRGPRDARPGRHRRDEHHVDRGEGTDARDRRSEGARRDDAGHPAPVLPRGILSDAAERQRRHADRAGVVRAGESGADAGPVCRHGRLRGCRRCWRSPFSSSSAS